MALPLHAFALVVVRHADRFLLIQERKFEQSWYFPAGRVDPGERLVDAAVREAREETGLAVRLTGLYRLEHRPAPPAPGPLGPGPESVRLRVFFAAEAVDPTARPKEQPDAHSLRAVWLTRAEIGDGRALRGDEVLDVIDGVLAGAPVHPLDLLVEDLRGWRR